MHGWNSTFQFLFSLFRVHSKRNDAKATTCERHSHDYIYIVCYPLSHCHSWDGTMGIETKFIESLHGWLPMRRRRSLTFRPKIVTEKLLLKMLVPSTTIVVLYRIRVENETLWFDKFDETNGENEKSHTWNHREVDCLRVPVESVDQILDTYSNFDLASSGPLNMVVQFQSNLFIQKL